MAVQGNAHSGREMTCLLDQGWQSYFGVAGRSCSRHAVPDDRPGGGSHHRLSDRPAPAGEPGGMNRSTCIAIGPWAPLPNGLHASVAMH